MDAAETGREATEGSGLRRAPVAAGAPDATATPGAAKSPDVPTPARRPRRRRGRLVRRIVWLLLGLAVVALLVYSAIPKPVPVDLATTSTKDMRVTVDESGRARVRDRYVLGAPLTGKLLRIELRPGDAILQGAPVARMLPLDAPLLDPRTRAEAEARVGLSEAAWRQARGAITRAEVALAESQRTSETVEGLVAAGAAPRDDAERARFELRLRREELASARFAADMAAHEVEMARAAVQRAAPAAKGAAGAKGATAVEDLAVPSPIAGRVLRVVTESADVVQLGTPLVEIGDPSGLEVVCDVLTPDAVRIRPGTRAFVERWGGEPLGAQVSRVEPSAFTRMSALGVEEQRVKVVLDLDGPREKWAALGDGYAVEVRIVVWEGAGVLTVPASAVFRHDGGFAVYAVEDGRAVLRSIDVGERNALEVEVKSGLGEGASVVVHPSDRVAEGVRVTGT